MTQSGNSPAGNFQCATGDFANSDNAAAPGGSARWDNYLLFRTTTGADSQSHGHYVLPNGERLDEQKINDWLTNNRAANGGPPALAVLVVREVCEPDGHARSYVLERRAQSPDGPYFGNPARVEVEGAVDSVRAWSAAPDGLQPVTTDADEPCDPRARVVLFAGEQAAVLATYGEAARITAVRDPTAPELLIGFSTIVHLVDDSGRERACGIGWHGPLPFVIQGDFQRIEHDPPQSAWRNAVTADQAVWLRYAERYEARTILDVRPAGSADDVLVLSADGSGSQFEHLIDLDGVELQRTAIGPVPAAKRA